MCSNDFSIVVVCKKELKNLINQNLEILNKIFFTEPQMLVEKYNEIDEATKKYVEIKITNLKDDELQEYLIKNQNKLLDILQ